MNRLNAATPAFYINTQGLSANKLVLLNQQTCFVSIQSRFSALLCLFPAFISSQVSLVVLWQSFLSSFSPFRKPSAVFALHVIRHIFEISNDSRMRITTKTVHDRNDDFALRYVRIYQGVNSRAELVTLAPGLRPERRFAPLARGLYLKKQEIRFNEII